MPGWQYKQQLQLAEQQQLHVEPHAAQKEAYHHQEQLQQYSPYAEAQGVAAAAAPSGLAAHTARYGGDSSGGKSSSRHSHYQQHHQQQQLRQPSAVIIDDLQLDSDEEEQLQAEHVAPYVPLDMPHDACRVLVALPCFEPCLIQHSFNSLQLPASYLLSALASALVSCKQQEQHQQYYQQSPGTAAQQLLPSQGLSCRVDLQLVAVAVEQHPQGSAWGRVGLVQRVSNMLHGAAVLQAEQHGDSYRCAYACVCYCMYFALSCCILVHAVRWSVSFGCCT
jgi:hypothetical protein